MERNACLNLANNARHGNSNYLCAQTKLKTPEKQQKNILLKKRIPISTKKHLAFSHSNKNKILLFKKACSNLFNKHFSAKHFSAKGSCYTFNKHFSEKKHLSMSAK